MTDLAAIKAELRTLLEKATPGPWTLDEERMLGGSRDAWGDPDTMLYLVELSNPTHDAALIVAAINALPLLLSSPDPVAGDGLREALQRLLDAAEFRRPSFDESGGEWIKARDLEWMAAVKHARAALAAPLSSPVEPPPGLAGPIGVEERVELARAMGRMQAEQEAVQAIGRIVMAAGGEVRVPDNLLVRDVTVGSDFVNGTTIYRAALLPTQASDSPEKP